MTRYREQQNNKRKQEQIRKIVKSHFMSFKLGVNFVSLLKVALYFG